MNHICHSIYSLYSVRTIFYIQEHFLIVKIFKKSSQLKPQDRSKCPIVYIVAGQAGSTTTLLQYYSSSLKHFSSTSQEKAPLKTGKKYKRKERKKRKQRKRRRRSEFSCVQRWVASRAQPASKQPATKQAAANSWALAAAGQHANAV